MARLTLVEFVTLDGVVQAPGYDGEDTSGGFAHGGWSAPWMGEHRPAMAERFSTLGALLLGRLTYEIFAAHWPRMPESDPVARALNAAPKYVASTTLRDPAWANTTVVADDLVGVVSELRQKPGDDILVIGSANLAQTLIARGFVDEMQLWVHPVVLGIGKRLFQDGLPRARMELEEVTTTPLGEVVLTYRRGAQPGLDATAGKALVNGRAA